ncbi:hypothetical protein LINGRAHAP2_LOCUS22765 [Linum grandiflorum]
MLTSLVGHLSQQPESLVVRILQGRFFPNVSLLSASKGSSPFLGLV